MVGARMGWTRAAAALAAAAPLGLVAPAVWAAAAPVGLLTAVVWAAAAPGGLLTAADGAADRAGVCRDDVICATGVPAAIALEFGSLDASIVSSANSGASFGASR